MDKPRILIVDDHAVLRSGLRVLLELQGEYQVIGEAAGGEEALKLIHELNPDIAIVDLAMPGMDGLTLVRRIRDSYPAVKVLVLTQHDDRAYLLPVLEAGASGYVLKSTSLDGIVLALQSVNEGKVFLDPSVTGMILADYQRAKSAVDPYDALSEREKEVLRLSAAGHTSREIAERLVVSPKTVDSYRERLMVKLGLHTRSELVEYALKKGLLTASE